jgi:N-dimethylarginine dimethylaminohydrolase
MNGALTAIVKTPPSSLVDACELTFIEREPINHDLLLAQHLEYRRALERAGANVVVLEATPKLGSGDGSREIPRHP